MKKVILFWMIILWSMGLTYADDGLWGLLDSLNNLPTQSDNTQSDNTQSDNTQPDNTQPDNTQPDNINNTEKHAAASDKHNLWNSIIDNTVYNLLGYVKWNYVYVYYIPWKWVKNVKISYSYNNQKYINIATLSSSKKFYKFPVNFSKKQIYIKVLPITNWNVGIMKEWTKTIPYITISLLDKKIAKTRLWRPKTWPELWLLFIFTILFYIILRLRKI